MKNTKQNNNTINDLRDILFEQIRDLSDKEKTPDIERARTIAAISQVMINSVKSEIEFYKTTGQKISSSFLPDQPEDPELEQTPAKSLTNPQPQKGTIIPTTTGYIHKSSCSK